MDYDVVIVGGGLAGGSCAEMLRESEFSGSVAVVAAEAHAPYHRPPLTKSFVRGETDEQDALLEPTSWYAGHDIDLLLHRTATAIDPEQRCVWLDDGSSIGYGRLVLATGAEPRSPEWDGIESVADRVFTIRTLEDSERVRDHLRPGTSWLVVGGGYIGVETAASACECGCDVTLVMREEVLWEQFYGPEVGGYFQRRLAEHGVDVQPHQDIVQVEALDGGGVRATTSGGLVLDVDYVLAGIGVQPRIDLAVACGLEVDKGVLCDEFLVTSDPAIYAAGDIAQYESVVHGSRMRIEHWDVARRQGRYVAERIAGVLPADVAFDAVPYFFSELGSWGSMQYVGPGMGDVVIRGDMEEDSFAAVYLKDDRLVALLAVDHHDDLVAARHLLPDHPKMDRRLLADESVPLAEASVSNA